MRPGHEKSHLALFDSAGNGLDSPDWTEVSHIMPPPPPAAPVDASRHARPWRSVKIVIDEIHHHERHVEEMGKKV